MPITEVPEDAYFLPTSDLDAAERYRPEATFSTHDLLDKPKGIHRFLINPKLLPEGGHMLLTGRSGEGKSIIMLHIAAALATGSPLFGLISRRKTSDYGKPRFPTLMPRVVLYVDYELPHAIRTDERLRKLALLYPPLELGSNLLFARISSTYQLMNRRDDKPESGAFTRLINLVAKTRPDVLILDPFSSTHSLNENSSEIKQALNNADRIIDYHGCAVILVHHASNKIDRDARGREITKHAYERPRGFSGIYDWADFHLHIERTPKADNKALISVNPGKTRWNGEHAGDGGRAVRPFDLLLDYTSLSLGPLPLGYGLADGEE